MARKTGYVLAFGVVRFVDVGVPEFTGGGGKGWAGLDTTDGGIIYNAVGDIDLFIDPNFLPGGNGTVHAIITHGGVVGALVSYGVVIGPGAAFVNITTVVEGGGGGASVRADTPFFITLLNVPSTIGNV